VPRQPHLHQLYCSSPPLLPSLPFYLTC
jgi:hypothetical protein